MRLALIPAETLETLRVPQHLTALLGQGDQLTRNLLLSRHPDREDLLGLFTSRHAAQGGEAKRHSSRILGLAHPVLLGHPEKRFDAIGAHRQADVLEPKGFGRFKLDRKIGANSRRKAAEGIASMSGSHWLWVS